MNKKVMFILGMILVISLYGCSEDTTPTSKTPYVGGKVGIIASFIEGAPPKEVFDNGQYPFGISVKLENRGESNINAGAGYVEILGINPADINLQQSRRNMEAMGSSKKNFDGSVLNGGATIIEFNDLNYIPDLPGDFDGLKIRANLCYDYTTKTSTKICVKKDLLSTSKSICDISGKKEVANSGGPIHITSLKQNPIGTEKIQFTFVVDKVGETNDRFFKKETECRDTAGNTDKNVVYVNITSDIGNNAIPTCSGLQGGTASEGYITLYDGAPRTVTCTVATTNIVGEFEDLLNIELSYRYMQFIEKPILIKDVSTN